jgi:hypothetical protein
MKGGARSVARPFACRDARRHLRTGGPNTSVLASMTPEGMGPRVAVDGSTTKAVFEAYVEQVLAAVLRPGQVVTDNLSANKGERVRS